jgi:hypothetical protein
MAAIVLILASAKRIEKVKKFLSAKFLRAALMSAVGHESNCLRKKSDFGVKPLFILIINYVLGVIRKVFYLRIDNSSANIFRAQVCNSHTGRAIPCN